MLLTGLWNGLNLESLVGFYPYCWDGYPIITRSVSVIPVSDPQTPNTSPFRPDPRTVIILLLDLRLERVTGSHGNRRIPFFF